MSHTPFPINPGQLILGKSPDDQGPLPASSPRIQIGKDHYWLLNRTIGIPTEANPAMKWVSADISYYDWAYLVSLHDLIVKRYPELIGKDINFVGGMSEGKPIHVIKDVRSVLRGKQAPEVREEHRIMKVGDADDNLFLLQDGLIGVPTGDNKPMLLDTSYNGDITGATTYCRALVYNLHPEWVHLGMEYTLVKPPTPVKEVSDIGEDAQAMGAKLAMNSTDLCIRVTTPDGKYAYYNDTVKGLHYDVPSRWPINLKYWANQKFDEVLATLLTRDEPEQDNYEILLIERSGVVQRSTTLGEYKSKLQQATNMTTAEPENINAIAFNVTDETGAVHQYDPAQLAKYIQPEHQYTPEHFNCAKEIINRLLAIMVTRTPMLQGEGVLYNVATGSVTYSNTSTALLSALKAEEIQALTRRHAKANFDAVYEGDSLGQLDVSDCLTHVQRNETAQQFHLANRDPMVIPTDMAAANLPGPLGRSRKQQEDTDPGIKELRARGVGINVWNDLNVPDQHLAEAFLESVNYDPNATYESPLEKERLEHMQKTIFGGPNMYKFPESLFTPKLDGVVPRHLLNIQRALSGNNDLFKAAQRDAEQRLHETMAGPGGPSWYSNIGPRGTSTKEESEAFIQGLFEHMAFLNTLEKTVEHSLDWLNALHPKTQQENEQVKTPPITPSQSFLEFVEQVMGAPSQQTIPDEQPMAEELFNMLLGKMPKFRMEMPHVSPERENMFNQTIHRKAPPSNKESIASMTPRELEVLANKERAFVQRHGRIGTPLEHSAMIEAILAKRQTPKGLDIEEMMAHIAILTGGEVTHLGDGKVKVRMPESMAPLLKLFHEIATPKDFPDIGLGFPDRSDVNISLARNGQRDEDFVQGAKKALDQYVDIGTPPVTDEEGQDFRDKLVLTYESGQTVEVTGDDLVEMMEQAENLAIGLGIEGEPLKAELFIS